MSATRLKLMILFRSISVRSLRLGSTLEDRPSYTPTSCFETFPLPWSPGQGPWRDPRLHAIAEAARELDERRRAWLDPPGADAARALDERRRAWLDPEGASEAELKKRTLTNLYNQRPAWLDIAHKKLDDAVLDAYGWPHDLSDEEMLERLLALNLERQPA